MAARPGGMAGVGPRQVLHCCVLFEAKSFCVQGDAVRRYGVHHMPNYDEKITPVACITADGLDLKPELILPLVNLTPSAA